MAAFHPWKKSYVAFYCWRCHQAFLNLFLKQSPPDWQAAAATGRQECPTCSRKDKVQWLYPKPKPKPYRRWR